MLHNCKSFNLVHLPVSNLHQGRAGQFTMTMKILLVMYYVLQICMVELHVSSLYVARCRLGNRLQGRSRVFESQGASLLSGPFLSK